MSSQIKNSFFPDNNQSHLFETSNEAENSQNIPTNDQDISTEKTGINNNDGTTNNMSDLGSSQQDCHNPPHVETREVPTIGHSTNVNSVQHLQLSEKARNLTSDNQMLFSGVQTIPEQLPLILTEGDAEEHESFTIIAGNEQLQV